MMEQKESMGCLPPPTSPIIRKRQAHFEGPTSSVTPANTSKRRRTVDEDASETIQDGTNKPNITRTQEPSQPSPARPRSPSLLELIRTGSRGGRLRVNEHNGDLFDAPPNTLLIHSCNSQAAWGAGIAKAFKKNYPNAFLSYQDHCNTRSNRRSLIGRAYLISPSPNDVKFHFVGCLFVSLHFGQLKSSPEAIHENTKLSMQDLLQQVREWNRRVRLEKDEAKPDRSSSRDDDKENGVVDSNNEAPVNDLRIREVRMCKINSGLFRVPWHWTKELLEDLSIDEMDEDSVKEIEVYTLD